MSKAKDSTLKHKPVVIWLVGIALLATFVVAAFTLARVNRLHRFFNAVSDEYRAVGGPAPSVQEPGNTGNSGNIVGGDADGRDITCATVEPDVLSDPSIGDPSAPVTIVEYSDFECPFCSRFVTGAYPQIKSEYIDTGKVRLVFKDFPLEQAHPLAVPTALMANYIAQELGEKAFFAFHDKVFFNQNQLSENTITSWAREVGLSEQQLASSRDDSTLLAEIFADRDEGAQAGISGTPSFIINGELVAGAQPFAVFQQSIEAALAGEGCEG